MNQAVVFDVHEAGRYAIGIDEGSSDGDVAAVVRCGKEGEPDELIQTLRRNKESGKWERLY